MNSHLIFEQILPHLTFSQIEGLRACNQYLRRYIDENRFDLPRYPLDKVSLEDRDEKHNIIATRHSRTTMKSVDDGNVMKYLQGFSPSELSVCCSNISTLFAAKWIEKIETITIRTDDDKDEFSRFVQNMKCTTKFSVESLIDETLDLDEVLDRMPHVEEFHVLGVAMSQDFLEKLTNKSQPGPGLKSFSYHHNGVVNVENFLSFVENAKFQNESTIRIFYRENPHTYLIPQLKRLGDVVFLRETTEECLVFTVNFRSFIVQFYCRRNDPGMQEEEQEEELQIGEEDLLENGLLFGFEIRGEDLWMDGPLPPSFFDEIDEDEI